MKLMKGILLNIMILFFVSCTAWPALIPIPPGKTKTETLPVPLAAAAATSTPTKAAIRITGPLASGGTGVIGRATLKFTNVIQLGAVNTSDADITSQITWRSDNTTIATVDTSGLVTANAATEGTANIFATNDSIGPEASIVVTVNATGTSILAFDGKNFIRINESSNTNEEK